MKKFRPGNLLVVVGNTHNSQNLLFLTSLFNLSCKCFSNLIKWVIRFPDLAGVIDSEIVDVLRDRLVTAARRIKIKETT